MSIDRPRRIFRGARHPAGRGKLALGLTVGLLAVAGSAALMFAEVSRDVFTRSTPAVVELTAEAGQIAVIDGETLRVGGTVIQLNGVSAPARGQACAAGPDCGGRAAAALAALLHDRRIVCVIVPSSATGPLSARCEADGRDINAALVEIGWAKAVSPKFDPMQTDAQTHRRGMWVSG